MLYESKNAYYSNDFFSEPGVVKETPLPRPNLIENRVLSF